MSFWSASAKYFRVTQEVSFRVNDKNGSDTNLSEVMANGYIKPKVKSVNQRPGARTYFFDNSAFDSGDDSVEYDISEIRTRSSKSHQEVKDQRRKKDRFIEIELTKDDTLRSLALKFSCKVCKSLLCPV